MAMENEACVDQAMPTEESQQDSLETFFVLALGDEGEAATSSSSS